MLANKWVLAAMSGLMSLISWGLTYNWSETSGKSATAAAIVGVLSTIKLVLNMIAPSANQTVTPTGNTLITHS